MVSGLPSEATFQTAGTPFSLAMFSRDIARTSDETPIIARARKEAQAMMRATEQMRCFISFSLYFLVGIVVTFINIILMSNYSEVDEKGQGYIRRKCIVSGHIYDKIS